MLLKEIPGVLPKLSDSAIAKSKIWTKRVETLHPTQLVAIRHKELELNPNSLIDQEIAHLILQIQFAVLDELCATPLIDYTPPRPQVMLTSEFIAGLKNLDTEYRIAVIFGLEMGLSAIRTANLTVKQAQQLENLTQLAQDAIRTMILSTRTIYMFWKADENSREHVPLEDLGEAVYEAFGLSWNELSLKYKSMVSDHYNPVIFS